jgi:hypothetical protein
MKISHNCQTRRGCYLTMSFFRLCMLHTIPFDFHHMFQRPSGIKTWKPSVCLYERPHSDVDMAPNSPRPRLGRLDRIANFPSSTRRACRRPSPSRRLARGTLQADRGASHPAGQWTVHSAQRTRELLHEIRAKKIKHTRKADISDGPQPFRGLTSLLTSPPAGCPAPT